jgi:aldehyde dehydrogenase (NAD+)
MANCNHAPIVLTHKTLRTAHDERLLWPIPARKNALRQLLKAVLDNEENINKALSEDLGRPQFEAFVLEVAIVKEEIHTALKALGSWSKAQPITTPIQFQPGSSYVKPSPKGVVLIIAPWNYPIQLSLVPLVSAIAAGNCAIIKPSELAPQSALLLATIVNNYLDPRCFRVINGDVQVAQELLDLPFDHIFYTGSTKVGKEVMKKAAHHLTPVTLELGGKSPAIIDETCDLDVSVKRLLWGKCVNAGQTCIAPDYVLINHRLIPEFIGLAKKHLLSMFGEQVEQSTSFGRIVNARHFERLTSYLQDGRIVHGGVSNKDTRFIEPTILIDVQEGASVMHDEIFGPILPIMSTENIDQAIGFINARPHPLALYVFSNNQKTIEKIITNTSSGGVCINDCLSHAGIIDLPFGGVGHSGFGNYHGKYGFLTFSHMRAVHKRSMLLDNPLKYAPYSDHKLKLARILL